MYSYGADPSYSTSARVIADPQRPVEVLGQDRHKFFRRPMIPFLIPQTSRMPFSTRIDCMSRGQSMGSMKSTCNDLPTRLEAMRNQGTQTDYRESETQTSPWEPPYKVYPGHNPEVLTLAHLTWNHGLPAGMHEVEIINRMRMRRAWEAILPPMDTSSNIKARTAIIRALESDDWSFREAEIDVIMNARMELMKELMRNREEERDKKTEIRFNRFGEFLEKWRTKEVRTIRCKLGRELRKLAAKHRNRKGGQRRKRDIIQQHADRTSELYAPQMRYGENPQRRHEVLRKKLLREDYVDDAEKEDTIPSWMPTYEELRAIKPKPKPAELCIRETRWNDEKLKRLHEDLKAIRLNLKPPATLNLMKRKYKAPPLPSTPILTGERNFEEELDSASTLIQKIVRGRAIQYVMFEGRDRCRELIEELQSTHALEGYENELRQQEKRYVLGLQHEQNYKTLQENRLSELLNSLEGMTVSGMLDYLSKELLRLQDERRAHAFALLAEREKNKREAAEAGRRQLERNRRREQDEMFRQILKVHQDSVEVYLEDIIKEGIDWVSDEQARQYIMDIAEKVDAAANCAVDKATELDQEEMVSDMIYNFVLPEVEKKIVRTRMRERQQSYLRNAHAVIYDEILEIPLEENAASSEKAESSGEESEDGERNEEDFIDTDDTWMRNRIVEETMDSARIVKDVLSTIISRVVLIESEAVVLGLLDNIISEVVKMVLRPSSGASENSKSYSSSRSSTSNEDNNLPAED